MTRTAYRNLMLALLVLFAGLAVFLFMKCQTFEEQIVDRQNDLTRLGQELENANRLNIALTELDQLTINEKTATQLDILRHLGLEQSDLKFTAEARDVQAIGNTSLYVHTVRLEGDLAYPAALNLFDRLQNTKKILINNIEINRANVNTSGDNMVSIVLSGRIYGLDKADLPPASQPGAAQ